MDGGVELMVALHALVDEFPSAVGFATDSARNPGKPDFQGAAE
jgi:hypothetical protein